MAFGIGDELSVRVSAQTGDAERGIENVSDKLRSLNGSAASTGAAMTGLAERTEEVGDEMSSTKRDANGLRRSFSALTASTSGLSLSFGTLSTSTTASLIPALGTLSTTIVPLTAGFTALAGAAASLAGAFGLVIGSGLLAFGQKRAKQNKQQLQQVKAKIEGLEKLRQKQNGLTDSQEKRLEQLKKERDKLKDATNATGALAQRFAELKKELVPIIADFGEQFIPLIEDALNAIPTLVENIFDAVGGLDQFRESLRRFGGIAMEAIPAVVGVMMDLARRALPILNDLVDFLLANGGAAFDTIMETMEELAPLFKSLLDDVLELLGPLNEMGTTVLQKIIPAVETAVEFITDLVKGFNDLGDSTQGILSKLLLLLPVFTSLGGPITAVVAGIVGLAEAFRTNFAGIRDAAINVANTFQDEFGPIIKNRIEAITNFWSDNKDEILNILRDIVDFVENVLVEGIKAAADFIKFTLDNLTQFWNSHGDSVMAVASDIANFIGDTLVVAINFLVAIVNHSLDTIKNIWQEHGDALSREISILANDIINKIRFMLDVATAFWNRFGDEVVAIVNFSFGRVTDIVQFMVDQIVSILLVLLNLLNGDFAGAWQNIKNVVLDTMTAVKNIVSTKVTVIRNLLLWLKEQISGLAGQFKNTVVSFFTDAFQAAKDSVMDILDGFADSVAQTFLSGLRSLIPESLGMEDIEQIPGDQSFEINLHELLGISESSDGGGDGQDGGGDGGAASSRIGSDGGLPGPAPPPKKRRTGGGKGKDGVSIMDIDGGILDDLADRMVRAARQQDVVLETDSRTIAKTSEDGEKRLERTFSNSLGGGSN